MNTNFAEKAEKLKALTLIFWRLGESTVPLTSKTLKEGANISDSAFWAFIKRLKDENLVSFTGTSFGRKYVAVDRERLKAIARDRNEIVKYMSKSGLSGVTPAPMPPIMQIRPVGIHVEPAPPIEENAERASDVALSKALQILDVTLKNAVYTRQRVDNLAKQVELILTAATTIAEQTNSLAKRLQKLLQSLGEAE